LHEDTLGQPPQARGILIRLVPNLEAHRRQTQVADDWVPVADVGGAGAAVVVPQALSRACSMPATALTKVAWAGGAPLFRHAMLEAPEYPGRIKAAVALKIGRAWEAHCRSRCPAEAEGATVHITPSAKPALQRRPWPQYSTGLFGIPFSGSRRALCRCWLRGAALSHTLTARSPSDRRYRE